MDRTVILNDGLLRAAMTPMTEPAFVHLRVHTQFSLSEGAIRIKELPVLCREMGMPAVAITDTNNLFGAMEFSATLSDKGIQPIIGCQLSLTRADGSTLGGGLRPRGGQAADPVVLLVQSQAGYANLLSLVSPRPTGLHRRRGATGFVRRRCSPTPRA